MRDFFEAQKHIIISLIVIIAITIVSGYFSSPQLLPVDENIDEVAIPVEPASNEPIVEVEKENDYPLQKIISEIPSANGKEGQEAEKKESQALEISVSLTISGQAYSLSLPEKSSVYDLMVHAREVHGISFGGKEYSGLGFFIDEINGVKNNQGGNSKYWIYSINGKKADVGVSSYIVKEGDTISWNYEDEE